MIKITKKIKFSKKENRMKDFGNVEESLKYFRESKNKNLHFVLKKRFEWMNKYIKEDDIGLEVGSGPGFSKEFITNKNNAQHQIYRGITLLKGTNPPGN